MHVVHAYKIYRPDADGGIPQVIHMLQKIQNKAIKSEILVARYRGPARSDHLDGVPVTAVTSIGTAFSAPLAPLYPFVLRRLARKADILVHHAPFPLTDIWNFSGPAENNGARNILACGSCWAHPFADNLGTHDTCCTLGAN